MKTDIKIIDSEEVKRNYW